jgi:hypothetical protein
MGVANAKGGGGGRGEYSCLKFGEILLPRLLPFATARIVRPEKCKVIPVLDAFETCGGVDVQIRVFLTFCSSWN